MTSIEELNVLDTYLDEREITDMQLDLLVLDLSDALLGPNKNMEHMLSSVYPDIKNLSQTELIDFKKIFITEMTMALSVSSDLAIIMLDKIIDKISELFHEKFNIVQTNIDTIEHNYPFLAYISKLERTIRYYRNIYLHDIYPYTYFNNLSEANRYYMPVELDIEIDKKDVTDATLYIKIYTEKHRY